ncbi:hypothetical protein FOA43_003330 [Brettanomyces nanus]|uniref:Uncharacterized protein n=1 Tax=Eeniella nana TaxID=13502 RepID=A0A875SAC8_EENNA|nr:uncharacterized protein FOA43_003330 [Brettanomyces nanus]QPG75944.1 hypothetical protein FOA43_003330 [Brettanomyces nanus]
MLNIFREHGKTPKRPSARTRIKALTGTKLGPHGFSSRRTQSQQTGSQKDKSQSQASISLHEANKRNAEFNSLTKGNESLFDEVVETPPTAKPAKPKRSRGRPAKSPSAVEKVRNAPRGRPKKAKQHLTTSIDRHLRNNDVITIPDDDNMSIEESETVLKTYSQTIRPNSMRENWTVLLPNVQTMLESILTLFIEQSLSSIHFKNKKDRLHFGTLVRTQMIKPLMKRFLHVKLPPGIKESHLDQEQLNEEKLRLETNYDANLKQLEALQAELLKENLNLKSEKKYTLEYESKFNQSKLLMDKSLKQLQDLLGNDIANLETDFINEGTTNSEFSRLGLQTDSESIIIPDSSSSAYDASKDKKLQNALSSLQSQLIKINSTTSAAQDLADVLERLHNILGLATED